MADNTKKVMQYMGALISLIVFLAGVMGSYFSVKEELSLVKQGLHEQKAMFEKYFISMDKRLQFVEQMHMKK